MPNYCSAIIWVSGRKDCVDEFQRVLEADYNYLEGKFSHIPHLWRIFEVFPMEYEQYGLYVRASFDIICAWSVSSCMLPGPVSYYDDGLRRATMDITDEQQKLQLLYSGRQLQPNYGTNIVDLSRYLGLEIEIISQEPGIGFMEHYRICNGSTLKDECYDYTEHYIGDNPTLQDYINEWPNSGIDLTEEQYKKLKDSGEEFYSQGGIPYNFDMSDDEPEYLGLINMCTIVDKNK